jgi:hypothetical protein
MIASNLLLEEIKPYLADIDPEDLFDFFAGVMDLTALRMHSTPLELCHAIIVEIEDVQINEENTEIAMQIPISAKDIDRSDLPIYLIG